jgi:hypothetical protein
VNAAAASRASGRRCYTRTFSRSVVSFERTVLHVTPEQPPPAPPIQQKKKSSTLPWILGGCALLLVAVVVLAVIGYGLWRWHTARTANPDTGAESPTGASSQSSGQPSASISPTAAEAANPSESAVQSPVATDETATAWNTTVWGLNGKVGQTLTLTCTPGGKEHSVWGSDIYTADSSICTAAVHAGLITFEQGGAVTVEVRPGRSVYGSTKRNGIATGAYGSYSPSFVFKSVSSQSENKQGEDLTPIAWDTPAFILSAEAGQAFKFECPPGGSEHAIWGTDVYTADSSICTAAAHTGRITFESGGKVTIELRPGQSSYQGTVRNGVKSNEYGPYGRSFVLR